jgi:hypothetical protein
MKLWIRAAAVFVLLLLTVVLHAQEDEEELPEIPYFRASSSFNVPVLQLEGWQDQSTPDDAIFVNDALSARIHVSAVPTLVDTEAIQAAIATLTEGDFGEPLRESRIGISNGTWTQQLFSADDTSISSFALGSVSGNRTFVVTLIEDSPDYNAHYLAIRSPQIDAETTDFAGGIDLAIQTLLGEGRNFELVEHTDLTVLGLPSAQNQYSTDNGALSVFAQEFDDITYATISTGDIESATQLGEAMETVFLGFFITPDNSNYLYMGLAAVTIIFGVLIGSMWLRYRNVQKDMALVEELAGKS